MRYKGGFGAGSPALHANLFRYAMLHRLGGWWVDLDVILLRPKLPQEPIFFAAESTGNVGIGMLKFPSRYDLLVEAVSECVKAGETAKWGQTGPRLLSELLKKYGISDQAHSHETAYPVPWRDIVMLFDPQRCEEVAVRCAQATFLHLYSQIWRESRLPHELQPPQGSYLDLLVTRHGIDFAAGRRMDHEDIADRLKWTATT